MTEPSPAKAMEAAVALAVRQLADGALVGPVLENLWRNGFAAGVHKGSPRQQLTRPEGFTPAWARGSRDGGWTWGVHGELGAGQFFRYGGTDPDGPSADRDALALARRAGRRQMELGDTGERVPLPALFWARGTGQAEGEDDPDG